MEIGALLPVVTTGTAMTCGAVRSGFGTQTRRPVLFALASAGDLLLTTSVARIQVTATDQGLANSNVISLASLL